MINQSIRVYFLGFVVAFFLLFSAQVAAITDSDDSFYSPNQTSASLLVKYAESVKKQAPAENKQQAEQKFLLVYDIYIKAKSYALLNKIFFWLSGIAAVCVLLWPSLGIIFRNRLSEMEWVKSAVVQTTVTGIAALTFAFYSQYKDKQVYAETLMRQVIFSEQSVTDLSLKVADELARIDRGFSFGSFVSDQAKISKSKSDPSTQ